MAEYISLIPAIFAKCGDIVTEEEQKELFNLHLAKARMSDIIFIINKNGYIGDSTKEEIKYAKSIGKDIVYLESINE